jgi:hypothetical protein
MVKALFVIRDAENCYFSASGNFNNITLAYDQADAYAKVYGSCHCYISGYNSANEPYEPYQGVKK